jgi:hypothetical protein
MGQPTAPKDQEPHRRRVTAGKTTIKALQVASRKGL